MKIYNKKNFLYGLGLTIIGVLLLLNSLWLGFAVKSSVILALCLFFGIGLIMRSLSRDMSREDKIAARDERNKLVEWRAKSRALGIVELICAVCILVSIVGMQVLRDVFGGMLIAFGLMYTIMLLTELFTLLYYDKKL